MNRVVFACAGSGKTTRLVNEALEDKSRRIAFVTYTNNNVNEIVKRFGRVNSGVPKNVDVMTWFGFLLRECARPYQRVKYDHKRIASLLFVNKQSAKGIPEYQTSNYYFANGEFIFSDKIAKFVTECEINSSKSVSGRLKEIYTDIFIDEFQDLAGWDLNVVEMLLRSGIRISLVGDPRQHIYSTNPSQKNKQYLGVNIVDLIEKWEAEGLCENEPMNGTYRCNQQICDFVNSLWPGMDEMHPLNEPELSGHDGIFLVEKKLVDYYIRRFKPQILRYDKRSNSFGYDALNFGIAKGLQFDRVLVVPTGPITKYLKTGDLKYVEKSREKFHVAITRARHSVAFVYGGSSAMVASRYSASET